MVQKYIKKIYIYKIKYKSHRVSHRKLLLKSLAVQSFVKLLEGKSVGGTAAQATQMTIIFERIIKKIKFKNLQEILRSGLKLVSNRDVFRKGASDKSKFGISFGNQGPKVLIS